MGDLRGERLGQPRARFLLVVIVRRYPPDRYARPFLGTGFLGAGFCGAYTTFSTFSVDTVRLIEEGAFCTVARNVVGSVLVGMVAAAAGLATASAL